MSAAGEMLFKSFKNPDDWEIGSYKVKHKPSGVVLWIANGGFFFDGYEQYSGMLGIFERWICWFAFKSMRSKKSQN